MRQTLHGAALKICEVKHSLADAVDPAALVGLASSPDKIAVRITGGAGHMTREEGEGVAQLLAEALGGASCTASVLAGATTVIDRPLTTRCTECRKTKMYCLRHAYRAQQHPGVMDVLARLVELGAPAKTVGLVPTIEPPRLYGGQLVVANNIQQPFYTVVNQQIPLCVLVQFSSSKPSLTWDDEWRIALEYLDLLRREGGHKTLHLVFNGGEATWREAFHVAELSRKGDEWPILFVKDSGRTATKLAKVLKDYPFVMSCTKANLVNVLRKILKKMANPTKN